VIAHLLGCFWFYTAEHASQGETDPCESGLLLCSGEDAKVVTWWEALDISEDNKWEQYWAALYWSFTTMTTVGYGDITPKSDAERVYAIFSMIFGATIFGYIVGSIAALAGNDNSGKMFNTQRVGECVKTKKRIAMIRDFCDEQNMTAKTKDMVRLHYQFFYQEKSPYSEDVILADLSPCIRKQVALHVHSEAIERLGLFQGAELRGLIDGPLPAWFTALVMRMLEPQVVAAGEDILSCASTSMHSKETKQEFEQSRENAQRRDDAQAHELFFVLSGECEAYIPRGWSASGPPGSQCDTGGSGDIGGTTDQDPRLAPSQRERIVLVFTAGCMFGFQRVHGVAAQANERSTNF